MGTWVGASVGITLDMDSTVRWGSRSLGNSTCRGSAASASAPRLPDDQVAHPVGRICLVSLPAVGSRVGADGGVAVAVGTPDDVPALTVGVGMVILVLDAAVVLLPQWARILLVGPIGRTFGSSLSHCLVSPNGPCDHQARHRTEHDQGSQVPGQRHLEHLCTQLAVLVTGRTGQKPQRIPCAHTFIVGTHIARPVDARHNTFRCPKCPCEWTCLTKTQIRYSGFAEISCH